MKTSDMKTSTVTKTVKRLPNLSQLALAVTSLLFIPTVQADTKGKKIGDLEIYSVPQAGTATMMMMLDTSGSMSEPYMESASACDISSYTSYTPKSHKDPTDSYTRYGCAVKSDKTTYFYKRINIGSGFFEYYSCGAEGSTDPDDCTTSEFKSAKKISSIDQLQDMDNKVAWDANTSDRRRFFYKDKVFKPDRLTRVKDAIFGLMDGDAFKGMDNKLKIGIGQFSSNVDNKGADGKSGRIIVPAKKLDDAQRQAIKDAVAKLEGTGNTPAAQAYAEAGAYMMGTTTKGPTLTVDVEEYVKYYDKRYGRDYYAKCTKLFDYKCVGYKPLFSDPTSPPDGYKEQPCEWYTSRQCLTKSKTIEVWGDNISGYDKSADDTKTTDKKTYDSPISTSSECDGNGIYFLTDGIPNASGYDDASRVMNKSLNTTAAISKKGSNNTCGGGLQGSSDAETGWGCMGQYSKLIKKTDNPKGVSIKTATVGFGSVYTKGTGGGVDIDCSTLTDTNAKNLCQLGSKDSDYGQGGFTATSDSKVLANSIVNFISELQGNTTSVPAGIIVVPEDPYSANSQQAVAYYPTIDAKALENNVIWPGNMKKYRLSEGTLYGKDINKKLFLDIAGTLDAKVQDLWSDKDYTDANNAVTSGGFYAHLKAPNTGLTSLRTLYIEDWDDTTDKNPVLRKFSVNADGKLTLDGVNVDAGHYFIDTGTYTPSSIKALLGFLGFNKIDSGVNTRAKIIALTLTQEKNAPKQTRVLGASLHSSPELVSYSAKLDADGRVTDDRDEYVLFGSMDGAMHLVNSKNYQTGADGGKEVFAFIPREIIKNQPEALIHNNIHEKIGTPKMGMDAPWLVVADYKYKIPTGENASEDGKVEAKSMYAYGGMRMGGDAFYGMNLTNKAAPTLLFTLSATKSGFNRMGQIWSKPTKAFIKTNASDEGTDVLVFGGGYDTCYENPEFQVGNSDKSLMSDAQGSTCDKDSAQGNAIYIINAKNGDLIWSASNTGPNSDKYAKHKDIKNSVVAGITVLDRDNDGYMDHLYFADLGGQVFRADFTNAGFIPPGKTDADATTKFENVRIQKILKNKYEKDEKDDKDDNAKYAYRFYERPVISFYRNPNTNRLFAMVNVISGDRSSPLSKMRSNNSNADRLYGIMDTDVTKNKANFFAQKDDGKDDFKPNIANLVDGDFYALPTKSTSDLSISDKNSVVNGLKAGPKKGWYYPLTRFDGYNNVKYTKGVGKSDVIGGFLYTTVYNPDMSYTDNASCTSKVLGGSERQLYCLPYGVCMDGNSKNGTGGFIRAGQGIQELTLGPRDENNLSKKLLIGTQTLKEQAKAKDRINNNEGGEKLDGGSFLPTGQEGISTTGGDASAPAYLFNERYVLRPTRWYESSE